MFIDICLMFFADSAWSNMFTLDSATVTFLEKIVRPIIIYVFLIFLFRLLGNRELAQLNPIDLIVLLLLSNTVQNAIIGDDTSLIGGVIGAVTLLGINYLTAAIKFKSRWFEKFVEGSSKILIKDGKINEKALKRELMTREDLNVLAHEEGFESADDLEKCVIDPNGTFQVEGKEEIKDARFKKEILEKIDGLTKQLDDLQKLLQKS